MDSIYLFIPFWDVLKWKEEREERREKKKEKKVIYDK